MTSEIVPHCIVLYEELGPLLEQVFLEVGDQFGHVPSSSSVVAASVALDQIEVDALGVVEEELRAAAELDADLHRHRRQLLDVVELNRMRR